MGMALSGEPTFRKPLRLWPGVVAVALLWLARFGLKAAIPGFSGFGIGMIGGLIGALAVLLWWAFLSRAPRAERWGAIVLMTLALGATWLIKHESMGPLWLIGYALPVLCLAFVAWAVASRRLADGPRRATMVATILLACGLWAFVRTTGINGDHVAEFAPRWTPTPEERLVAAATPSEERPALEASGDPAPPPSAPAAAEVSGEQPAGKIGDEPAVHPSTATGAETRADWPGFRGPGRDGVIHGVWIESDWSRSPPVALWRRPIGPGWSSFAVSGDRVYTQEQRGDAEVVTCYNAATGQPVWTHRDAARFFESNGGAGPRATPTLSGRRVYAFGATGILNALDARNGAVVWSRNVSSDIDVGVPIWGFSSSPLVVDEVVIVAAAGQLVAYNRDSGDQRWRGPTGGGGYSSPQLLTIGGVVQVVLQSDIGATSVSPADGTVLWTHQAPGTRMVQPAQTADGNLLISDIGGTRRIAVAHGPGGWTTEERWTSNGMKPYFNDFVVHKGHAFGFDGRILASINLEDGTRTWKGGRYGNGQLVLLRDQDLLLVISEDGELALVGATPDQFTELARFPAIEGKTWNHPVLVGDVLLVRNGQEMVAFRLSLARR